MGLFTIDRTINFEEQKVKKVIKDNVEKTFKTFSD